MRSSDLSDLLTDSRLSAGLTARAGKVIAWDTLMRNYIVEVGGVPMIGLPMLGSATMTAVYPGDTVLLWRYRDSYIIAGKVMPPGKGTPEPNLNIPMYPQFYSGGTANTPGVMQIGGGSQADWYGYANFTHPKLRMVANLGPISGSPGPTCDIQISVNSVLIDQFTISSVVSKVFGPWDISQFIDSGANNLVRVRKLAASSGSGQFAFQIYTVYQQSY
jgi:hypothetical protein